MCDHSDFFVPMLRLGIEISICCNDCDFCDAFLLFCVSPRDSPPRGYFGLSLGCPRLLWVPMGLISFLYNSLLSSFGLYLIFLTFSFSVPTGSMIAHGCNFCHCRMMCNVQYLSVPVLFSCKWACTHVEIRYCTGMKCFHLARCRRVLSTPPSKLLGMCMQQLV